MNFSKQDIVQPSNLNTINGELQQQKKQKSLLHSNPESKNTKLNNSNQTSQTMTDKKAQTNNTENTKNLRNRSSLRQMKLNFADMAKGNYDGYGYSDEEEDFKRRKRSKSRKLLTKRGKGKKSLSQDEQMTSFTNKKKVKVVAQKKEKEPDNNMGFLIGWRNEIQVQSNCVDQKKGKVVTVPSLEKVDFSKTIKDLQAIYINILWKESMKQKEKQLEQLRGLQLQNKKILRNGIIFIWVNKEVMAEVMNIMDEKEFVYIENFSIMNLSLQTCEQKLLQQSQNPQKKQNDKNLLSYFTTNTPKRKLSCEENEIKKSMASDNIQQRKEFVINNLEKIKAENINEIILKKKYEHYNVSKKILLMFRRQSDKNVQLELRHQRTSDVVFDLVDEEAENSCDQKMKEYVYKMIETLLPKARVGIDNNEFKMMEIFADPKKPRSHWLGYTEQ